MLFSMTGFARKSHHENWGTLVWEVRSVNHRYLEISIRMPEFLRDQEIHAREIIQKRLKRGKVEAYLKYQVGEKIPYDFELNHDVIKKLSNCYGEIKNFLPEMHVNFMNLLDWQGVLTLKETNVELISEATLNNLQSVLDDLISMREREGTMLNEFLAKRVSDMHEQVIIIENKLPETFKEERKRLQEKFEELKLNLEPDRLEQEMVWALQKADIAEEVSRLKAHLKEVIRVLDQGGVVGRRLDFLMQELNRETNTIASKSANVTISQATIEMKVLIEQMREQVQNIE